MGSQRTVFLFGDQTYDVLAHLPPLLRSQESPILNSFFEQAYCTIREEIGALSTQERKSFCHFTSISSLLEWRVRDQVINPPVESALTCIYHLASFISQHDGLGKKYPSSTDACVLTGLCTGSLAAAAVSCCSSLSELLPVAVETVRVAFRTGLCVWKTSLAFQDSASSWSFVIANHSAEEISTWIKEFCNEQHISPATQPYITAYTPNGLTVSGPPAILDKLRQFRKFAGAYCKPLSVYAPYHSSQLFSTANIDWILKSAFSSHRHLYKATLPVISSTTGSPIDGDDFQSRLPAALRQILLEPIRWQHLCQGLSCILQGSHGYMKVLPFGSNADSRLLDALKSTLGIFGSPQGSLHSDQDAAKPSMRMAGSRPEQSKIAIIGMSGRYPSAENNDEFWDLLLQGLDVHKEVPSLHWDSKTHVDTTGTKKNTSATPYGCWLENPAAFDARFFNMSPREAPQVDPAQRIALMTTYEAIEQAGIVPDATPSTYKDRVGVFYGVTSNDWMETNSAQNIDTYFIPGGNRAFIPGRVNYFFKFSGPSYSVDTACSSSLAAVHIACNALWRGDIDTAIAGGTNVLTNPDFTAGLDRGHFLSRTGNCKTFDDGADGYCRGEGVGTIIMKRLEDAISDNDPIKAVILGAYTNHSAEAESITRPHVGAQKAIFEKILNSSGVDPYSVSYVEMHGTGTQAGDAGEMSSVLNTFAPTARPYRNKDQSLHIGSAKANIGHGEAVSGVTSLAKVLLMLENNTIPPHCGIKTQINKKFPIDMEERNVHIAKAAIPWTRTNDYPRRAFVNNFSAAGGNSAILVEEAPQEQDPEWADPRTHHTVAVSAKCAASLTGNIKSLLAYMDTMDGRPERIGQLSYTTTARRIHHLHRVMVSGSNISEINKKLNMALDEGAGATRPTSVPKAIFSFTGQGAQYVGMANRLFQEHPAFHDDMQRFNQISQTMGFPSILGLFEGKSGTDIRTFSPLATSLASVCMQMALSKLWRSWGIAPHAVVGHSLGEYAALNAAGVLSDADTIFLVGKRGELLEKMCTRHTHSMLVVRASLDAIRSVLRDTDFEVACINAPEETVVAGTNDHLNRLQQMLANKGFSGKIIAVPYAYHSAQVDSILDEYEVTAQGVIFNKPSIPVISPLLSEVVTENSTFNPHYLVRHCRETVDFLGAMQAATKSGIVTGNTFFIELGPHAIVTGLVKAIVGPKVRAFSTLQRNCNDWQVLTDVTTALYNSGLDFDWQEYQRPFKSSHKVLQLPAYAWNLKDYWMQYVNDWSLRKGDPPLISSSNKLESTTIHEVLEESSTKLVVQSDIARDDLSPLVQGHAVDGIPLCTPSVYADIALTIGKYLLDKYHPEIKERLVDIADMTIQRALILKSGGPQWLRTSVTVDWATKSAMCRFVSHDGQGKAVGEHSHCTIKFTDRSRVNELSKKREGTQLQMSAMRKTLEDGKTQRFNRVMVYKMISPLAQFHQDYRAIDEVIINSNTLEASSRVNFKDVKAEGNFHTHPAYIDGLTQSGGFVMNCNDNNDLDVEVFVNHGWKSLQLYEELSADKTYSTWVQMFEKENRMYEGDVTVYDGSTIVASYRGIVLQGVPRRVLRYVLSVDAGQKPKVQPLKKNAKPTAKPVTSTQPPNPVRMPAVVKDAPAVVIQNTSNKIGPALKIISEESGIAHSDLNDDCVFADIGIDSLLSLVITSRLREELDMNIEIDDLFTNYPTLKDLKAYIGGFEDGNSIPEPTAPVKPVTTEIVDISVKKPEVTVIEIKEDLATGEQISPVWDAVLAIIADESGVAVAELTDDCNFADMGIDSLLSLVIVSRVIEEIGVTMDIQSIFTDCPTVKDLKTIFFDTDSADTSSDDLSEETSVTSGILTPVEVPPATSVLLQGNPKHCSKTIFLFPDGAGSATSYSGVPRVDPQVAVVGLNSPYYRHPELFKCDIHSLIKSYIDEVRNRQPSGPYSFGGWSAGGILAYRAAQEMIDNGESVENLVLIDSPVPKGLDRLPQHFYDYCNKMHIFGQTTGSGRAPEWLVPHFNATIDTLHTYVASPLPANKVPRVSLIWACDSVMDGKNIPKMPPNPDDTEGMKFLTEARTDFSGNGWEELFPKHSMTIERATGANHFTMMRGDFSLNLARFIRRSLF